jgi:hypothetical protein
MMFNNLGLYSYLQFRRPFIRRQQARRVPVTQISSSVGGYGNDFINLGTITNGSTCICTSVVPVTDVIRTPFTPASTDYFLCVDIAGPASIILPTSVVGKVFVVKDCDGDAHANPITITATGSTIDGSAAATINVNYGSLTFVFNGTEWSIE